MRRTRSPAKVSEPCGGGGMPTLPGQCKPGPLMLAAITLAILGITDSAGAIELDSGNPDVKIRWDNTVKYSLMHRMESASPALSAALPVTANQDDGNNNFSRGLVSNRLDLFSELDFSATNYGARVSAAAWYDGVYNQGTSNTSFTSNHNPRGDFPDETRKLMGRNAEVLDAFVWGKFDLGEKTASVRLGRHTLLWGESLFFGANGIAGGQAPLDLIKLLSVPNATFKEIAQPTGKLSGQVQLTDSVTLGAYLGYEWKKTRLGAGAERINAGPAGAFTALGDIEPSQSGQGGVQLRWRADSIDTDFGLYAIRYHATGPSNIYTTLTGFPPALTASTFQWAYHEGIRAFGASFAKTINEWSLAGEVSIRQNTPLASSGQAVLSSIGVNAGLDNASKPGYAVGETVHAQFSWLASLGPSFVSREASFLGEIAWNNRTKVTLNEQMLNPNADQAAMGIDLTPSIGMGYTWGRSSAVGPAFGVDKGGDINLGVSGVYLGRWTVAANYVHYLGEAAPTLDATNNAQYLQALKDRNFLTLSIRTTF
jgi:hypothetical protein